MTARAALLFAVYVGRRNLPVGLACGCGRRQVGAAGCGADRHVVGVCEALHTREAGSLTGMPYSSLEDFGVEKYVHNGDTVDKCRELQVL